MRRKKAIPFQSNLRKFEEEFEYFFGTTKEKKPREFLEFISTMQLEYNCRMQERILAELINIRERVFMGPDLFNNK